MTQDNAEKTAPENNSFCARSALLVWRTHAGYVNKQAARAASPHKFFPISVKNSHTETLSGNPAIPLNIASTGALADSCGLLQEKESETLAASNMASGLNDGFQIERVCCYEKY
ncbi:hypothetical protein [Erwinia sp. 9145]|uniref:hypothetical protein n=1 Tax=Erwinia sp. 9145 TaxID=1500895 RepID=UPI00055765A8|nr:hypothetical protein [Erwinia sp. 9145]